MEEKMNEDNIRMVVEALRSYHHRYHRFPNKVWLLNWTKLSEETVNQILHYLVDRKIIKKSNQDFEVVKKRTEDKYAVAKPKVKESPTKSKTRKPVQKKEVGNKFDCFIQNTLILIFRIISAGIGLICVYVSIKFTYFFNKLNFDEQTAMFLSIGIVSFLIISFNVRDFFRKRKNRKMVIIFTILWFVTLLYSMTSTLSVQAIKLMENEFSVSETTSVEDNKVILYKELEKRIDELKIELNATRKERDRYKELLFKLTDINSDEYKKLDYSIARENSKIDRILRDIKRLEDEKAGLLKEGIGLTKKNQFNFYEWLSKVFGSKVNPLLIQFILSTFAAVFIDIVGPLSIYIALFLRQEGLESF